ncbi:MAG: YbaB/EbfC family nucleoid-associated protein [Mycobacteriaceae bacterium]|nr:YbaB/EbfC family nucleoid-associated protein [Mycobacteriaceae bacterium]
MSDADPAESVDIVQQRLQRHAERLATLTADLAAIRVSEQSADGAVTVVVDGAGAMVDLQLTPAISRMGENAFAKVLIQTAAAAANRAFAEQAALIQQFNAG